MARVIRLGVATACAWLLAPAAQAQIAFDDFSSTSGLALLGDASQSVDRLQLTSSAIGQAGAAWYTTKQHIAEGFETRFEFQLSDRVDGGSDGLAFVIQNQSTSELGGSGERMGYDEIVDKVAIEFDTYQNAGPAAKNDPPTDQYAVMTSANHDDQVGDAVTGLDFGTAVHGVHIVYEPGTLKVFLDGEARPSLTVSIDLGTINGGATLDSNGDAWVGFSAATGSGSQIHDILSWSFRSYAVTTIITHGFQLATGEVPDWAFRMGEAVLERAAGGVQCGMGAPMDPVGTMFRYIPETFTDGSGTHLTGTWEHECGALEANGPIVLVFDWATESDLNSGGAQGMAEAAADALYAALRDARFADAAFQGLDPLAFDVHFIGHSRGTVVHSEAVERLALAGVAVDHVTMIDPHPVNGTLDDEQALPIPPDFGDSVPQVWTNVAFADDYYRDDGGSDGAVNRIHSLDFDGTRVPDADVKVDLDCQISDLGVTSESNDLDADLADINDLALDHEHVKSHAWYYGTILVGAADDRAGTDIDPSGDVPWYYDAVDHDCVPAADATGYGYALIGDDETRPAAGSRAKPGRGGGPDAQYHRTIVYNGDFEIVDDSILVGVGHAGWRYQGGSMLGITPWNQDPPPPAEADNYYFSIDAVETPLTHNWLYVDSAVDSLHVDLRVTTPSSGTLEVHLVDENGASVQSLGSEPITTTHGWQRFGFPVPAPVRARSHRIEFRYSGLGSVDIDNIGFAQAPAATPGLRAPALALVALLLLAAGAWRLLPARA